MKARTRKIRWLLISLLFGLLAAAGLTLTLRHGVWIFAKAHVVAPTPAAVEQLETPLVAANGAEHAFTAPDGAGRHWVAYSSYSDSQEPVAPGHSDAQSNTSSAAGTTSSGHSADAIGDAVGGTPPQDNHPVASNTDHPPPPAVGELPNGGYAALDCELPAGCGAPVGTTTYVTRQPSGTSGTVPSLHNSQDGTSPPTDDGNSPPSDPPLKPSIIPAPELDPATLAAAVTLLLGSLAVLRSRRRAHATR